MLRVYFRAEASAERASIRRRRHGSLYLFLSTVTALLSAGAQGRAVVDSIGITVADLDRAIAFYSEVLDFEPVARWEVAGDDYEHAFGVFGARVEIARMRLGDESIELMEFLAPRGRPIPGDTRSNDVWFQHVAIIVSDMERAYRRLRDHHVEHASSGPQQLPDWNPSAGGIAAFYFRDPDGNHLEILHFPSDKGDEKWHRPTDRLFRGIDHTAIVVTDTATSLGFYAGTLRFSVVGESENYGIEQERLNNVFGAHLRITSLRADAGPGVELLEYLAPRTGRSMPIDTQSNDLWHWQVNVRTDGIDAIDVEVRDHGYRYVSSGIVDIGSPAHAERHFSRFDADSVTLAEKRVLLVRDPDGHAIALSEPGLQQ